MILKKNVLMSFKQAKNIYLEPKAFINKYICLKNFKLMREIEQIYE